jgi:tRNA(Ile)-lysidine synthase
MLPRTVLAEFNPEIPLVRPLLDLWRADTEAYCRDHGLDFLTDASNADPAYFRNRLRLSLIPELEHYNARFKEALLRSSQALQGDFELISGLVDSAWDGAVAETGIGFVAFDRAMLNSLPLPLRRALIRRAAFTLQPGLRDVDFDALERAASLPPSAVDIAGGLALFGEGGRVYLAAAEADLPSGDWPQVTGDPAQIWEWEGKGQLELADGLTLKGEIREHPGERVHGDDPAERGADWVAEKGFSAWLRADWAGERLLVRTPRPGDRIEPHGMPGKTVKLSDLFINHKIPRRLRRRWPLVCVGDEIAWVPGLRVSERFHAGPEVREQHWLIVVKREQK